MTLVAGLFAASPALACRWVYCAQRLAPADGLTLPANAQVVVASGKANERYDGETNSVVVWRPWVRRIDSDGGVQLLEAATLPLQPTDEYGKATLFTIGALMPGSRFRLESSEDCSVNREPAADVHVVEAAPFPSRLGTPLSPPAHRIEPTTQLACSPDEFEDPSVTREVQLELDDSVRPWLSLARVHLEVNGRPKSTDFGRLARGHDGGPVVLVERLTRRCFSDDVETWPVRLELELPGVTERPPPVEFALEMDCRPSCAAAGGMPWLLGLLLYRKRRP